MFYLEFWGRSILHETKTLLVTVENSGGLINDRLVPYFKDRRVNYCLTVSKDYKYIPTRVESRQIKKFTFTLRITQY